MLLVVVAFAAGLIAGISPCILPVLPVVFFAGAVSPSHDGVARNAWRRPIAIIAGLIISFSILVLAGSSLIAATRLPSNFLHDLGIGLLLIIGLGFLVPRLGEMLERPFARLGGVAPSGARGGFVIGLALGLVFVPCAGPILAAITVLGATHHVGILTVFITVSFAVGATVPLLFVAFAGERLVQRARSLRERAVLLRRIGGVVLLVMALGIATNAFDFLQRAVPGYTSALQRSIEGSSTVRHDLNALRGGSNGSLASCPSSTAQLVRCGVAPEFTGITAWLNTANHQPLTMAGLRGKVVLIDFWTYSCINCQRTLPHVEAWAARYAHAGLVVVGVHTPEFAFEHVVSNIAASATTLGVRYPIAVDNNYGTWNAYNNQYWPAEYLVDASGVVRHVDFGEGNYTTSERLIRQLLTSAHPGVTLPPLTSVPDLTPNQVLSPETYLGFDRAQYLDSPVTPVPNVMTTLRFPASLSTMSFALSGEWTQRAQYVSAGARARLELSYQANDVYLVIGGSGTVRVTDGAGSPHTIVVSGVPRLYTLHHGRALSTGTLGLSVSPGVQLYDFTFG